MKSIRISNSIGICCFSLLLVMISCSKKQQSADQPGDFTALQDFPKEWVLVADLAPPDSITRDFVILVDSSNVFLGGITIKQNGSDWQMINSGFFYPGTYLIKNCKRTSAGEMVYYDFNLQSTQDTTTMKFNVNFRHHPEDSAALTSVFTCTSC